MDNDQFQSLVRTGEYSETSNTSSASSSSDSPESYSLSTEQCADEMRGLARMIIKIPVVLIIVVMFGKSKSDGTYIGALVLFLVTHFVSLAIFPKDKDCW